MGNPWETIKHAGNCLRNEDNNGKVASERKKAGSA